MFWWIALAIFVKISVVIYCYNKFYPHGHSLLITHPFTGPARYILEWAFQYIRTHLHKDWEERPFNRLTRQWVKKSSKGENNYISFGSEIDPNQPGTIIFTNSTFPILEEEARCFPGKWIGKGYCDNPYFANSFFNITGMSYGSLGRTAVESLASGSALAGIWMNTGEGGFGPPHHLAKEIVIQIGTAKYGVRDEHGNLDEDKLRELAENDIVKMFEIKLSQGAKPGSGGILPAVKVTKEIADIRGIPVGKASISPNRHKEIYDVDSLMEFVYKIRQITNKPVGIKLVVGGDKFLDQYFSRLRRKLEYAPDFITVDGTEGGTGAAPQSLADYVGLPLAQGLVIVTNKLEEHGLRDRIKVIASGKLVTPDKVAWALCIGADFVVTGRGFMLSMGCIQAMKCASSKCPKGIATNDPKLMKALNPQRKSVRVANYARTVVHEVETIAHSCGLKDPSEFTRKHARIITGLGKSKSLAKEFPHVRHQK